MLVIVEDRDVEHPFESLFNVKAFRRFDVFEIDAPERGGNGGHNFDDFIGVVGIDLDVEHVHIRKFFE